MNVHELFTNELDRLNILVRQLRIDLDIERAKSKKLEQENNELKKEVERLKQFCIELENQKKEQHSQWQQRCTENHNEDSRRIDKLQQKLEKIKEQLKNVDFTQCSRCDGCGYYEGCADEDCSTYILYKISEIMER